MHEIKILTYPIKEYVVSILSTIAVIAKRSCVQLLLTTEWAVDQDLSKYSLKKTKLKLKPQGGKGIVFTQRAVRRYWVREGRKCIADPIESAQGWCWKIDPWLFIGVC